MTDAANTDVVERSILIKAPRARVWRALTTASEFGQWFGCDLSQATFTPGQRARGPFTMSGMEHVVFDAVIDRIEPTTLMSYYWHPYAVDPKVDYSGETPTLVTFTLHDADGGATVLKVVESGFDKVPPHRRVEAFQMHQQGWEIQLANVARYAEG
jgi:uncharacterized protein YndB with AHSA1/START domain